MRATDGTKIALLALMYRTLCCEHVGCLDELYDFAEENPGGLSWAVLIAPELLAPEDWEIVGRLSNGERHVVVARSLRSSDPDRAEIVLHSKYPHGMRSARQWAVPLVARWDEVRAEIERFKDEGLTTSHDDVELIASGAWQQVTGGTEEAFEEAWGEAVAWHEFVVTSNALAVVTSNA